MDYQHIFFILAGIGAAGVILLAAAFIHLKVRWYKLFGKADSKEAVLTALIAKNADLEKSLHQHDARLKIVEAIAAHSIHKIGFLRFNPFAETGGDNSFALTLLDHVNNGVIISGLYLRDGMRIYAKAIERGNSHHPLSKEEETSLQQAFKG